MPVAAVSILTLAAPWPTTPTAYPHYGGRTVYLLTGTWDFAYSASYNVSATTRLDYFSFTAAQAVPGAWDAAWGTGLQYARGAGVYRTSVLVPAGQRSALHFLACSLFCRVYVDGELLHNHTLGGFTPFWVDVPADPAGSEREVIVLTSNTFSSTLTPTQMAYYDFYQFGGLLREVQLHVLPTDGLPSLKRVEVVPLATAGGRPSGAVNVTVVLQPESPGLSRRGGQTVRLTLSWDGGAGESAEHAVAKDGSVALPALPVPNPTIWHPPSNPVTVPRMALHTLTVSVAAAAAANDTAAADSDAITVRFGLRIVSTQGRAIRLNGVPLKLKGFNRHDMYPNLGPTLSTAQYEADLSQAQLDLKANFLRGSHYPQDPRLLDLCDERGILVWEETLAWGDWGATLTSPPFLTAELGTAHAMLDEHMNHPSVILWAFFNEGQSDNASAVSSYAAMADAFRSRDVSRLITWADNRMERGLAFEHADVVSFNAYPGWYNGPASNVSGFWRAHAAWVAQHWPDKPFIISETGAGGIVGNHSSNQSAPSRWSLEYQTLVDGLDVSTAMDCPNISGIALWQLMDIKVDEGNTSSRRPGGINNKGVLDRWRRPKPAAAKVASIYASHP